MRELFTTALALGALFLVASTGLALERMSVPMGDVDDDGWAAGATCTVSYYNRCTGWFWVWSADPDDRIGVCFDGCGDNCELLSSRWYWYRGAPSGYGFTGTIAVESVDASCCPTGTLASQPFLPREGWITHSWDIVVPGTFAIVAHFGDGIMNNPDPHFATDHPAAGPTGPQACGLCFPTTRTNHSFYWGTITSPLCPGSPINDGVCDAQMIMEAQLSCVVSADETSWATIKSLYR